MHHENRKETQITTRHIQFVELVYDAKLVKRVYIKLTYSTGLLEEVAGTTVAVKMLQVFARTLSLKNASDSSDHSLSL